MSKHEKSEAIVLPDAEKSSGSKGGSHQSDNTKDKPPGNFWEFVWKWMTESGDAVSWWGRFTVAAIFALTPETRDLAMEMSARGWVEFRRNLNWTVNSINAAVRALLAGGILLAAVSILTLVAAAQIPVWTVRWKVMGLSMLAITPILLWMYSQVMDIAMRLGAIAGAGNAVNADAFKAEGGLNPVNVVIGITRGSVIGGLGAMWSVAKKLAWMGMWVYVGIAYPMIFPAHNVPELLWLSTPLIMIQIVLHTFREAYERGKEWGVLQRLTLIIFAALGIFWMLPEGIQVLTMEHGSTASLVSRILAVLVGLYVVVWAIRSTDKDMEKQNAAKVSVASASTPTPVSGMDSHYYENNHHQPKTNYALRAIGPAFLLLMVVAVCATIILLKIQTQDFQQIIGPFHL